MTQPLQRCRQAVMMVAAIIAVIAVLSLASTPVAVGAEATSPTQEPFRPSASGLPHPSLSRTAQPHVPTAALHFPLRRSGAPNRKMMARTLSDRPGYKRLLAANAHGAQLNAMAAKRRAVTSSLHADATRPMSPLAAVGADGTAAGAAPLAGCPFADFTIPVTIGAATFELIVDTGSATLALAGSSCTTCVAGGVSPLWGASSTSVDQQATTSGAYGDHTGWQGEIWKDSVSLAGSSGRNITLPAEMRIVVITSQSTSGQAADGSADADANSFFVMDSCADQTDTYQKAIVSQGIVGLALQDLAAEGTDSFTSALYAQHPELPQVFSMQMCEGSGNLWWGGLPPREFVVGSSDSASELGVLYTPLYGSSFYTVAPSDIYIGGVSQSLSPSDFAQSEMSSNAVDSGTTMWELPETAYRRVVDALLSDPAFKKYFRASASDNFFDHALDTCESAESAGKLVSYSALQRELPTITVQFTNGLSVTMDGVGSYLIPCNKDYDQWTPGITASTSGLLGGWPLMNQFITVHDVANKRLGFAPAKACAMGVQSLRTNVSMGAPHPEHVDSEDGLSDAGALAPTDAAMRSLWAACIAMLAMAAFNARV